MAENDIRKNYSEVLKAIVALRDVAKETRYHICDILDPCREKRHTSQVMATSIVSFDEILEGDFSAFEDFTDYLHTVDDLSQIVTRVVHHGRVAVAMNAGERYFFEHGECRLFDPDRKHLFEMIDKEVFSRTGKKKKTKRNIQTYDKGGHGVFENMKNNYIKLFHTLSDAIILLYSFYIPCSIDYHNCASLLKDFVRESDLRLVVGYGYIHEQTDKDKSLNSLNVDGITVLSGSEISTEIQEQISHLIEKRIGMDDDIVEVICKCDKFIDKFAEYDSDFGDVKKIMHKRMLGRGLCRQLMKEYNMFER